MTTHQNLSDIELVNKYREGDIYSLYILINQRFKKRLMGVLGNVFSGYNNYELEERLNDFFYFLSTSKKDGENRLSSYNEQRPLVTYISKAIKNWAIDTLKKESVENGKKISLPSFSENVMEYEDDDDNSINTNENVINEQYNNDELNAAIILTLEQMRNLKPQSRYIVLTYLLCERIKTRGTPLQIYKKLAEQLNMTEGAVKMVNKRTLERIRNLAKKILEKGVTFS